MAPNRRDMPNQHKWCSRFKNPNTCNALQAPKISQGTTLLDYIDSSGVPCTKQPATIECKILFDSASHKNSWRRIRFYRQHKAHFLYSSRMTLLSSHLNHFASSKCILENGHANRPQGLLLHLVFA